MRIGIEIHQRLNTGKLFCRCPSQSKNTVEGKVYRRLHVVRSELGEKDVAAVREELKHKLFEYFVYDNSCLVECDEEPPHSMDPVALRVAIAVASYLNMKIVDQIFVMRKIVIDGSNPSGFQRTAIVGLDGWINSSRGKVGIQTLCIEEESAGILDSKDNVSTFGLNRLGIPLIEIATAPDIVDGAHAKEVAESLGIMLRMNGMAARGIGTIRQDLNISVEGGARVEIKGVQELEEIPLLVENEVMRQKRLIEINQKIPNEKPVVNFVDVSEAFKDGKGWLQKAIKSGMKAVGVVLPGLKGILGTELYSGKRFGTELSDYAKTFGFGGIIHGDEDFDKYGVDKKVVESMFKGLGENDSYVILVGSYDERMKAAFEAIVERAYLKKVPSETRRALPGGGSQYMRPMASSARMYPETDVEYILVDDSLIKDALKYLPRNPNEVLAELEKLTNKELAAQLIRSRYLNAYWQALKEGADPIVAATTFTNTLRTLSREGLNVEVLEEERILEVLAHHTKKRITKKAVEEVLRALCKEPSKEIERIIEDKGLERIRDAQLNKIVQEEGKDVQRIMAKYRLRVEAEDLMNALGK